MVGVAAKRQLSSSKEYVSEWHYAAVQVDLDQVHHLLFDGPPVAQRGQTLPWPRLAWVSTSWSHRDEVSSPDRVSHIRLSGGDRSYPTIKEECTWKTQNCFKSELKIWAYSTVSLNKSMRSALRNYMSSMVSWAHAFALAVYYPEVNILAHSLHTKSHFYSSPCKTAPSTFEQISKFNIRCADPFCWVMLSMCTCIPVTPL